MSEEKKPVMVIKKTWDDFRDSGLLWWTNRILHTFGWSIVVDMDDGKVTGAYPARVKFRGFGAESEEKGFQKVSTHIKDNIDDIVEESFMD